MIRIEGAREHNLRDLDVEIPLGLFVAITGVSGSGKSTLIEDILHRALARHFYRARVIPGAHKRITGALEPESPYHKGNYKGLPVLAARLAKSTFQPR